MGTLNIPTGAGQRIHRVVLQTKTQTADSYNQLVTTWTDGPTYPCAITQHRTRMSTNAEQQKAERFGTLEMRYFGPIDQTMQRFRFGSRILNIIGVENVEERNREYRITYQELIGAAAE